MPSKGKRKGKTVPTAPLKRQEPPPPCQRDCNCLGCLDNRSDTSMAATPHRATSPPPTTAPQLPQWQPPHWGILHDVIHAYVSKKCDRSLSSTDDRAALVCISRLGKIFGVETPKFPYPETTDMETQTEPPPPSSVATTQTESTQPGKSPPSPKQNSAAPPTQKPPSEQPPPPKKCPPPSRKPPSEKPPPPKKSPATRAVIVHAAPTKYKPGEMRRWIEEDNRGVKVAGIRWLLQEGRRLGKTVSSLVVYLATPLEPGQLRMGRKLLRTTGYDWDRPTLDKGKGRA